MKLLGGFLMNPKDPIPKDFGSNNKLLINIINKVHLITVIIKKNNTSFAIFLKALKEVHLSVRSEE